MEQLNSKENFITPDEVSENLKEMISEIDGLIEEAKKYLKGAEADLEFSENNRELDIEAGVDKEKVDDEIARQKKHIDEIKGNLDELKNMRAKAISGILKVDYLKIEMDKILTKMNEPQNKKHIQ